MPIDTSKYAACIPPFPVRHRHQAPFQPRLNAPPGFMETTVQIRRLEGELDRVLLSASDYADLFVKAVSTNIHYSTKLEGNKVPLDEVTRMTRESIQGVTRAAKSRGHQEVLNHLSVWLQPDSSKMPWDLGRILELHRYLFDGVEPSAKPGQFRKEGRAEITDHGNVAFYGAPAEHIEAEMKALLDWTNNIAPLFFPAAGATILFHAFESIHPFADGNGRLGRTLFHLYLQQQGLKNAHLCLIEPELVANNNLYYNLLAWTDHTGEYREIIGYFADAIAEAYTKAVREWQSKDLQTSLDETSKRLLQRAKHQRGWFRVADAAQWVASRQSQSDQTVRKRLNELVDLGALEAEGKTQARRYRFADPLAELRAGLAKAQSTSTHSR